MRISKELLASATEKTNPVKERMLVLRGFKISVIENLGLIPDYIECLDFTDNNLIKLSNFPPMKNLRTILASNNLVSRIDSKFIEPLPNLNSLVLINNKLESLSDLVPLSSAKNLTRLSLCDNPIVLVPHYREFCIHNIPSLRFLDFQRITDKERNESKALFSGPSGKALLKQIVRSRASAAPEKPDESAAEEQSADRISSETAETTNQDDEQTRDVKRRKLNDLTQSILNASSVDEVNMLKQKIKEL